MTVETRMCDPRDQFPVGMRVLAVDDDPTCLFILENLLRKCQYEVTTTSQAITALQMLRENKDKYDLVISDVQMPDMDGFKLLELVGLEMDLPVIMLSAYGDTKLVMKGITHGACDYLLKPVRIEELKNIWQHVVRRKKFDPKEEHNNSASNKDKPHSGSDNAGTSNTDSKMTKKRKDQDEEENEDRENGDDNEDLTSHKKARVVWTMELHAKFVAAVHHLGFDHAVPKKILDLMNVEKLTRENVASHLQKYRLYLKKMAKEPANMVAGLGTAEHSYLRMNCLSGNSGQFQNNASRSFPLIGRLNSQASLGLHGLPPSRNFQLGHPQNLNNPMNDPLKFQSTFSHCNPQNVSAVHATPLSSIGIDNDKAILPISSEPLDLTHGSRKLYSGARNNNLLVESHPQNMQFPVDSQHLEFSVSLLDQGRCNENWSDAVVQSSGYRENSYPTSGCYRQISGNINNNMAFQGWIERNQDAASYHSNVPFSSMKSLIPSNGSTMSGPVSTSHALTDSAFLKDLDFNFNFGDVMQKKHDDDVMKKNQAYVTDQLKATRSCISNNHGSQDLEDLVCAMINEDHQDKAKFLDGDFIYNNFSAGNSM